MSPRPAFSLCLFFAGGEALFMLYSTAWPLLPLQSGVSKGADILKSGLSLKNRPNHGDVRDDSVPLLLLGVPLGNGRLQDICHLLA